MIEMKELLTKMREMKEDMTSYKEEIIQTEQENKE